MAAPTVNPASTVFIGFPTGETIAGTIRETQDNSTLADLEDVLDENNDVVCTIISNPGKEKVISAIVLSAFTAPAKGDSITVNSIVYLVHDIRVTSGRTVKRMTITIRKPDSVTYTTA
jgi:hypothetical protein